ncbi:MAG: type II toxin-antitoxin system RelE/ParE family toxin [Nanoarchaeota archaeon]|nr:type II toxin-antitoxin system RelE/ParE family toxin [Nanoarchaeota archaeon]MBU1028149.1 type II toxin-antitoxin system RelE/ParE family toxin [Nanoarchaeota archaeon]
MFVLEWKEGAINQLQNLDINLSKRIYKKVDDLKTNPFTKNIKRLKGEKAFRLRIGDYRVIFDIDQKKRIITILRLGHRKNIYKN